MTLTATGSTGYSVGPVVTSGGTIINQAYPSATSITDANGNAVSITSTQYKDSFGLVAATASLSVTAPTSISWTDVNTGSPQVTVNMANVKFQTNFGCPGVGEIPPGTSAPQFSGLTYPDGTSLGVTYEPTSGKTGYVTGRIQTLTLPTGGTVTYTYGGEDCAHGSFDTLSRATADGTTTYTSTAIAGGNTTRVVDQGGNTTVYQFIGGILTQIKHNQDAGTLLTTDVYCYNAGTGQPGNCPTAVVSLPIKEVDVYHTINGMATSSRTQTKYDKYGNVTYSAQYDFGAASPTTAATITYGSWNGTTCAAVSTTVNNKPCQVTTAQNGNTITVSRFTYDTHGNLLTTYVSPNGGSSFLSNTTVNSYNGNGTPATIYDLANHPTGYGYSSSGYLSCSTCTNFPFPTSVTKGGLTTSYTWNGIGGVMLTQVGPNGSTNQTTTYGYKTNGGTADPFWRVSSVTDPLGNEVFTTYPTGSSPDTASSSFSFNSGNSIQNTTTTVDGYGRPVNLQTKQGPTAANYDTVSTSYIWGGSDNDKRVVSTNIPCAVGLNGVCPVTNQLFADVLGRTTWSSTPATGEYISTTYSQNDILSALGPAPTGENLKIAQKQYDGLGRLQFSCAIGSVSGSAACGQSTGTSSGVTTSYMYPSNNVGQTGVYATRGAQTRSKTFDSLGRAVSYSTPEGGNTTYTYDTLPSSCNGHAFAYAGKLIYSGSANGNYSCYQYDVLGRVTAITGISGSNVLVKRFFYDNSSGVSGTIPPGITISNPYGRLVEAETDSGGTITDEWFSYDKDGNMTDAWELTPHSGTYYHSQATFAGNGVPLTVQLANPSLYTETYGLDGEGRPATLTSGTQVIVSGTTFNAALEPTFIDLGTGTDQSDYIYDPNTGRMTNWTFQVGSTGSETGALTWNPNGTLNKQVINDGFNSAGSQTCTFGTASVTGYDDLGRLLSDNCGSVWAQTFSYDQYDNITKSGSSSWNPGYSTSPSNNHYSIGSYDNSGNILSDTFHTYTWNPYNKLSSVDSSACGTNGECITYDALGRIVETSASGVYTELWYTQMGKTVYMHGATPVYAYWPTPGGGTVEINGNNATAYYMHEDWLGNSRISSTIVNHTVVSDQAYAPYGEVYNKLTTGAGVPGQMFTGDTQDILSGLFDTPNRELNASQGRWLSPDPAGAGWNQYAYVGGNPLSFTDPLGLNLAAPGQCNDGNGICPDEGAGANPDSIDNGNGGTDFSAIGNSSSDCPICSGAYGAFGTADIYGGFFGAGQVWGAGSSGSAASYFQEAEEDDKKEDYLDELQRLLDSALEPLDMENVWRCLGCIYPDQPGPLSGRAARSFKWYLPITLKTQSTYYRYWGPPAGLSGTDGTYYSFFAPEGSQDFFRDQMSLPSQWNSMQNLNAVTIPAGTTVYIGPAAAQSPYSGGGLQVYVPNP